MKPSSLKLVLTSVALSFVLLSCSKDDTGIFLNTTTQTEVVSAKSNYSALETDILKIVNDYRKSNGIPELQPLNVISSVALGHTDYMIKENKLSHDGFEQRVQTLMNEASAKTVAENVAFGYGTAEGVVNAWLSSADHRAVIENPNFNYFGISTEKNANGNYYFTQIFIRK